jgi:DNA-binding CsgD family transcriptional regulator
MAISTRDLVGREEELGSLLGLLAAPDGMPLVAVVAGEAGIGKTSLWLAALEEAGARGYLVLSCRPSQAEARFSFSGLADLVGGVAGEVLTALPGPQRRALEAALALSDVEEPVEEGVVAFGFLSLVTRLAEDRPVVLAVDDVQWLDAPSLSLLSYALPRLRAGRVVVLLTVRGSMPSWLRRERVLELELSPLSLGALQELLRTRLDAAFPRPVLLRIWETSGGNPFFALELARALQRRGDRIELGAELPVPGTLEALIHERLELLTPEGEEVCRVVAALGEPIARLVESAAGDAVAGLEDALRARVLGLEGERVRFTHPLLASAIVARLPPAASRAIHERLAKLAPEAEERARHLALAADRPDPRVAEALDTATRDARARGAVTAAAELAEQALRLTPPGHDEARRRRRLAASDLHFHAGDPQRAIAALEGDDSTGGPARAAVLLRLGRIRAETSGADEAVRVWREALREAAGNAELEARILLELGSFLRFTEGAEQALGHAEAAVEAAARLDDDELKSRTLATYGLIHLNSGRGIAREAMERALDLEASLGERRPTLPATPFLVHQLVWSGELQRGREAVARWLKWASSRDHPDVGEAQWYLALLEWRAGNWEAAARAATDAVTTSEQFGRETATITSWPRAVIAAHRGELDLARELADRGLSAAGRPDVAVAGFEWVLGFIELSRDGAGGAVDHLDRAAQLNSALGILEPAIQWFMPDLLDALVAAGELDQAEATLAPWEERARALDRSWAQAVSARTRALIDAAGGDLEAALARFDESLAEHVRTQDPFQHARTLLALGATQRRAKRRADARATLEQTLGIFEELGAPLWADKARAELARIGGRAPSRGELTEGERRIAALVAEGRTNREVATALFLTEHTVETALTRVYRKLDVRSRAELAGRLARESGEAPSVKT